MTAVIPVTLICGDLFTKIGDVEVPQRPQLTDSPAPADFNSDNVTVTVTTEIDTAKFGRNLAALLRAAADTFEQFGTTPKADDHV